MDILTNIPDWLSLLFGGSIISIVTWRFARQKAAAEAKEAEAKAKQAEAEARKAEAEAMQEKQNYYQQMVDDMAKDRDYYKSERDMLQKKLDELTHSVFEWKTISEEERMKMKQDINMLRRQMDCIRPFLCGRENCTNRLPVTISDDGAVKTKRPESKQKDIDPIESSDL